MAYYYCPCCYGRRVHCRLCKTDHCGCSWSKCEGLDLEDKVLATLTSFGGAVVLSAIEQALIPVERKDIQAALRRLARKQKVYAVKSRYWSVWE